MPRFPAAAPNERTCTGFTVSHRAPACWGYCYQAAAKVRLDHGSGVKPPSLRVPALCPRLKEPTVGPGWVPLTISSCPGRAGPQDLLIAAVDGYVVERARERAGAGREGDELLADAARPPAGALRVDLENGDDDLAVGADHYLAPVIARPVGWAGGCRQDEPAVGQQAAAGRCGVQQPDPGVRSPPGADQRQGLPVRGPRQRAVRGARAETGTHPGPVPHPLVPGGQGEDMQRRCQETAGGDRQPAGVRGQPTGGNARLAAIEPQLRTVIVSAEN